MELKVSKLNQEAVLPNYSYEDDAGFDLYSIEDVVLEPFKRLQVKTGIAMQIPAGYVGLIWDKSRISHKLGIKNLGGVIDSGYRGEIMVGVVNLSDETYSFNKGDKVAQMIIQKKETCDIVEVDKLDEAERGDKGFGSSGK
jgi:dUTP pyrophosphatase